MGQGNNLRAVDFDYLEAYAGGEIAVVMEVLGLFREQAALWLPVLDSQASAEAWRDAAHSLKGTALGIGAAAMAQACLAAEGVASEDASHRQAARAQVLEAVQAVLADIVAYQGRQRG